MINRTKNPAGPKWNRLFAMAEIADGLVRLATFGRFHTSLPLSVSRCQAYVAIQRAKTLHFSTPAKGGDHEQH